MSAQILTGDCLVVLRGMADNSVDAIVTDPPYGLTSGKKGGSGGASQNTASPAGRSRIGTGNGPGGFMGLAWDSQVPDAEVWREALRVLKPGGHIVAFFGARTYHRGVVAIEDAGFEVRDQIMWVFGSGFPKSLNVAIAIDKQSGAMAHRSTRPDVAGNRAQGEDVARTVGMPAHEPITDEAKAWNGWGTALKPAHEPIVLARKPLVGTVAANVLAHGTGALNIDGCRVPVEDAEAYRQNCSGDRGHHDNRQRVAAFAMGGGASSPVGRWPANVVHDGSEEVVSAFPQSTSGANPKRRSGVGFGGGASGQDETGATRGAESGSAARFFYCAKASRKDRGEGNNHPTVKPIALMRWLCRLITPPGGLILDPFAGSGSTGVAAVLEGFRFIGIEREDAYAAIAEGRIAEAVRNREELAQAPDSTPGSGGGTTSARQARIPGT